MDLFKDHGTLENYGLRSSKVSVNYSVTRERCLGIWLWPNRLDSPLRGAWYVWCGWQSAAVRSGKGASQTITFILERQSLELNTLISIKSLICLLRLVAFRESGTWAWISGVSGICFLKSPLWLRLKRKLPEWMLKLPGWMCYPHDVGCGEKAVARFFKLTDNDCAYLRSTVWLFNTLYISI